MIEFLIEAKAQITLWLGWKMEHRKIKFASEIKNDWERTPTSQSNVSNLTDYNYGGKNHQALNAELWLHKGEVWSEHQRNMDLD